MLRLIYLAAAAVMLWAQAPAPQPPAARPKIQLEPDELAYQAAARIKDPAERNESFIKFIAQYPTYPYIRNTVFYLGRSFKDLARDPEKIGSLVDRFVEGTAGAPRYARTEFYYGISKALAANNVLLDRAAGLAEKSCPLADEADYIANERRMNERKRNYDRQRGQKSEPFSEAEAREKFRTFHAGLYANLGDIYIKQGRLEDAQKSMLEAYRIRPVMEAAAGLAEIMEKRGRDLDAFNYMTDAMLTGRLTADKIAHLDQLYRKTHPGQPDGLQAFLDAKFREQFHNPLPVVPYRPEARPSGRVVLAEFVTGAACEPCTAVDLAFDTELQRYSRNDLALLVYHMHAPTSDPMSNHSAEARHKFYDAHGAPTVYIDGQHVEPGEGLRTEADRVYRALDDAIQSELHSSAQARLEVTARLEGPKVKVSVGVRGISSPSPHLRLQIALAENEVSYSGENGLRFHPFVLRNLAQASGSETPGFALTKPEEADFQYVFDLDAITAANLKYYDEYIEDLKKRTNGAIVATFKEKRYVINPANLSIVAFVQDEESKQVLQAAYQRVSSTKRVSEAKPNPVEWSLAMEPSGRSLKPGDNFALRINAVIGEGWHLYSTEQAPGGPLPTRIIVPEGQAFERSGNIEESAPTVQFEPAFNLDTQFFEDNAVFTIPCRVMKNALPGNRQAKVSVTFQTCNGRMCLPPRTAVLTTDVSISQ